MRTYAETVERWNWTLNSATLAGLKEKAMNGHLGTEGLRSLGWRILFELLPSMDTATWPLELTKERKHYEELKRKFIVDPNEAKDASSETAHPLSLDEHSPWSQFFQDQELRKVIQQDVDRTYTDLEYFRHETTKTRMTDILFVYSKLHQDISYRQGMHELLALMLWAVDMDAMDPAAEWAALMGDTLDVKYVEHDAFALFHRLMGAAKQWYEFKEELRPARIRHIVPTMPILRKAHKIHHEYLQVIDHELYIHLEDLGIEPQIYAIRWLRLLFGREFPVQQVYRLWDAMFADDTTLSAADFVCVAMLVYIRDDCMSFMLLELADIRVVLQSDYANCLHYLMRFPPIADITVLAQQARALRDRPTAEIGYNIRYHNAVRAGREHEFRAREEERRLAEEEAKNPLAAHPQILELVKAGTLVGARAFESIKKVRDNISAQQRQSFEADQLAQQHEERTKRLMADALSKAVEVLERELFHKLKLLESDSGAEVRPVFSSTSLVSAVTVVKHVRDVLRGDASDFDIAVTVMEREVLEDAPNVIASNASLDDAEKKSASVEVTPQKLRNSLESTATLTPVEENVSVDDTSEPAKTSESIQSMQEVAATQSSPPSVHTSQPANVPLPRPPPTSPPKENGTLGVLQPKAAPSKDGDEPISSLKPKLQPRRPPRKLTVEEMMNEVGETKVESKHAWLFGEGETGASKSKTMNRRSMAVSARSLTGLSKSPAKEEENGPLFGISPRTKKATVDPLGASPALPPSKGITTLETAKSTAALQKPVDKVTSAAVEEPAKPLDPLAAMKEAPSKRANRHSMIARSHRTSKRIVPAEALLTEVDDWESVLRQEQHQREETEKMIRGRRVSIQPEQLGAATSTPTAAILPEDTTWISPSVTAGATVNALLGAVSTVPVATDAWSASTHPISPVTVSAAAKAMTMPPPKSTLPVDDGTWSHHRRESVEQVKPPTLPVPAISASDAWASHEPEEDAVVEPSTSFSPTLSFEPEDVKPSSSRLVGSFVSSSSGFLSRALSFGASPPKPTETIPAWPQETTSNSDTGFSVPLRNHWGDDPANPWD